MRHGNEDDFIFLFSRIESFSPHVFQFLILLSYECFQPKFNQAKSVFGMERIIQVCDDLMACGQSARTHGKPDILGVLHVFSKTEYKKVPLAKIMQNKLCALFAPAHS